MLDAERFDLHLHTTRSDGGVTEEALLLLAGQRRLDAIAITDHDQAPSLPAGRHDVAGRPVWLIHGAEVSAIHEGREIHVLAFFPGEVPDAFRAFLAGRIAERRDRYVATRTAFGLETGADTNGRAWTRFHLAQDLVDAGLVINMSAAFAGPLRLGPFGVPLPKAIQEIGDAGGLAVWAHPHPDDAQRWAKDFRRLGMWGLESARPGLGKAVRARLQLIAHKAGLGITGGSDWHARGGDLGVFSFPRREARPFLQALADRGSRAGA
jgi:predicted metal-dependent phosphoesterase TrpH